MKPDLHERVALAMKASISAGTYNSYEAILKALREKYPTEAELQAVLGEIEARLKRSGIMPKNMTFPDDGILD